MLGKAWLYLVIAKEGGYYIHLPSVVVHSTSTNLDLEFKWGVADKL